MMVSGSNIHFDFAGTDPQVPSAINNVPASTNAIVYYAVRTLTSDRCPNNEGCYRPISIDLPEGSIVNCSYPAPVAARGISLKIMESVILGVMAEALPQRMPAGHSGQYTKVVLTGYDAHSGRSVLGTIGGPYAGGNGARPTKDGIDVTEHGATNGSPIPLEVSEAELPIRFRRVELWTDSGGAGTWRGGLGFTEQVEWLGENGRASFRRDRMRFPPWGTQGGHDGPLCLTEIRRGNEQNEQLPGKARRMLDHGDIICIDTTGSGGYGPPWQRDPELVLADVLDRRVSSEQAFSTYGVMVTDSQIDYSATRARRAKLARARNRSD